MMPLSISQLPPHAPVWMLALAIAGLAAHIGGGGIAILTGYGAMIARKGGKLHRRLGNWFFAAMMVMGLAGSVLAFVIHQQGNVVGGILAVYLTLTAWLTVRRREKGIGAGEFGALAFGLAGTAVMISFALGAQGNPDRNERAMYGVYYAFAGLTLFAALFDLKVIAAGGIAGVARISRHLWRMGAALTLAASSFFLGQQKVMPRSWHGLALWWVLAFAPLVIMLFWLVRVRTGGRTARAANPV